MSMIVDKMTVNAVNKRLDHFYFTECIITAAYVCSIRVWKMQQALRAKRLNEKFIATLKIWEWYIKVIM